jgi:Na+/serine symporter
MEAAVVVLAMKKNPFQQICGCQRRGFMFAFRWDPPN